MAAQGRSTVMQGGAAEARVAHNHEAAGSNPAPATKSGGDYPLAAGGPASLLRGPGGRSVAGPASAPSSRNPHTLTLRLPLAGKTIVSPYTPISWFGDRLRVRRWQFQQAT